MSRLAALLAGLAVLLLAIGTVLHVADGSIRGMTSETWMLIPLATDSSRARCRYTGVPGDAAGCGFPLGL